MVRKNEFDGIDLHVCHTDQDRLFLPSATFSSGWIRKTQVYSSCILKQLPFPDGIIIDEEFDPVSSTQKEFELPDDDLQAITNSRGLKMAHLNINGLLSKLDFIKIMLSESKFDIFAISESKQDASIHDNENKFDGYDFYRLDHNRHGGVYSSMSMNN